MDTIRRKNTQISMNHKVLLPHWLKGSVAVLLAMTIAVSCMSCTNSTPDDVQSSQSQSANTPNPGISQQRPTAPKSANVYGNTAINIENGGFVAKQDDWIYYNNSKGLYRIKTDGTEREFLFSCYAKGINVVGNYVYYRDTTEQGGGTGLWRLDLTAIDDPDTALLSLDERCSADIYVVGDWIYYELQTADSDSGLWRMRTDGTGREKIYYNSQKIMFINIQDDWIYFVNYVDGILRMKTDGTNAERLLEIPKSSSVDFMVVMDDWIFYHNTSPDIDDGPGLYKMKTDGSDRQLMYSITINYLESIYISDNWAYYYVRGDNGYELHKASLGGTEELLVCPVDHSYNRLCIIDGWAYKLDTGKSAGLYRINLNGTDGIDWTDWQVVE